MSRVQAAPPAGSGSSLAHPRFLSARRCRYLPPLTSSLLRDFFEDSRLSNRLLSSYLERVPMLQQQQIPKEMSTKDRSKSLDASVFGNLGLGSTRSSKRLVEDERGASRRTSRAQPQAVRRVNSDGPKESTAEAAERSTLAESVRRLRQQLAAVEAQLSAASGLSRGRSKSSAATAAAASAGEPSSYDDESSFASSPVEPRRVASDESPYSAPIPAEGLADGLGGDSLAQVSALAREAMTLSNRASELMQHSGRASEVRPL